MARLEVQPGKSIYFEHYEGSGSPIVLVHGWGMGARIWDLTLPILLEAGHEVVVYDHRCCGRSDKDFADASTASNADDLVQLIHATGVKKPVVLGWSFGAAIVAEAAGRLGDELGGIVLVGPPTPRYTQAEGYPHGGTAEIMEQTLAALRDTRPEFLHALTEGVCHQPQGENTIAWMWQMFMETSPRADGGLGDLGTIDHREMLPTITVPALVCKGAHDAVVDPAIADVCADLLPNSRLVEFADSGHAPFMEERDRFNAELLAFAAHPSATPAGTPA
jgi:pimeloyl-[acyl-carrier protein] methyl ester esterase